MKRWPRAAVCIFAILLLVACDPPEVPLPPLTSAAPLDRAALAAGPGPVGQLRAVAVAGQTARWGDCRIEQLDEMQFWNKPLAIRAGQDFTISGFAFSRNLRGVPEGLVLRVLSAEHAQAWEVEVTRRVTRLDLARSFKLGDWVGKVGVRQTISSAMLAPGRYELSFGFSDQGKRFACDQGGQLIVES